MLRTTRSTAWLSSVMGSTSRATLPLIPRATTPLEALAAAIPLESLTITRDVMPGRYVARAVILDLQPFQMVAAIMATEDEIMITHRLAHRTGWSATSDGLRLYFTGGAR